MVHTELGALEGRGERPSSRLSPTFPPVWEALASTRPHTAGCKAGGRATCVLAGKEDRDVLSPSPPQTHLSSVDPRFSISLATSAISSFSLCGTDSAGLPGQEDTDQNQSKGKQNETRQTEQVNLSNSGKFIYSMRVYRAPTRQTASILGNPEVKRQVLTSRGSQSRKEIRAIHTRTGISH